MKRARALIPATAVNKEATAVTAAAGAVVMVEAAIATAIVAPAATTANQGGDLASSTCVSGRWISVSDREGGPQIRKRQKSDGAKASISILALFIWVGGGRAATPLLIVLGHFDRKRRHSRRTPNYFLAAGIILNVKRSLPRTISTSYCCPAFISPNA